MNNYLDLLKAELINYIYKKVEKDIQDELVSAVENAEWDANLLTLPICKRIKSLVAFLEKKLQTKNEKKEWWFFVINAFIKLNEMRKTDSTISAMQKVYQSITSPKKLCKTFTENQNAKNVFEDKDGSTYSYVGRLGHFQKMILENSVDEFGVSVDRWKKWVQIVNRGTGIKKSNWTRWDN